MRPTTPFNTGIYSNFLLKFSILKYFFSKTSWPANRFESYLWGTLAREAPQVAKKLSSVEETKSNLLQLQIVFEELNKSQITEKPKIDVWSMLSTIGGSLGLYVGVSVITIFEFFEFGFQICKTVTLRDQKTE